MRERKVEDHLRKRVAETGGWHRKCQWIGRRGAPDDFVGWPYVHGWCETKRPGKGAEAHQQREHTRMRAAGCIVEVCDTIEAVDLFVNMMVRLSEHRAAELKK